MSLFYQALSPLREYLYMYSTRLFMLRKWTRSSVIPPLLDCGFLDTVRRDSHSRKRILCPDSLFEFGNFDFGILVQRKSGIQNQSSSTMSQSSLPGPTA